MSTIDAGAMPTEKPVISPINTDPSALPTPDPSTTTTTAAKKKKKKKKKKSKAAADAQATIEAEEEDPLTPTGDGSKSDLPPTPTTPGMSSSEFMPLTEGKAPDSPPAEEEIAAPMEASKPKEKVEEAPEPEPVKEEEPASDHTPEVEETPADKVSEPEALSSEPEKVEEPSKAEPPIEDIEAVAEPAKEEEEEEEATSTEDVPEPLPITEEAPEPEKVEEAPKTEPPIEDVATVVEDTNEEIEDKPAEEAVEEVAAPVETEAVKHEEVETKEPEITPVEAPESKDEPEEEISETKVAEEIAESEAKPKTKVEEPVIEETSKEPETEPETVKEPEQSESKPEPVEEAKDVEEPQAEPESVKEEATPVNELVEEPQAEEPPKETEVEAVKEPEVESAKETEPAAIAVVEETPEESVAEKAAEPEEKIEATDDKDIIPETTVDVPEEEPAAAVESEPEPEPIERAVTPVPEIVVEKTAENQFSYGDDPGPNGTQGQKDAFEMRKADAEPDQVVIMEKEPEPTIPEAPVEEDDGVLVDHDQAKPEDVAAAEAAVIPPPAVESEAEEPNEDGPQEKASKEETIPEEVVEDIEVADAKSAEPERPVEIEEKQEESKAQKEDEEIAAVAAEPEIPTQLETASEPEIQQAPEGGEASEQPAEVEQPVEDLSKEVKVDPLPASDDGENAPPTEEPHADAIHDHVKLDKESFESSEPNVSQILSQPAEAEDLSKEVTVDPLPASDSGANAPNDEPSTTSDHVKLDKEAYESTEPSVFVEISEDLSKEVKVDPLPASDNAENAPPESTTASIGGTVKLDKEAYESTEPNVPQILSQPDEAEDLAKEIMADPLPASDNGENAFPEAGTASIDDHVKLDQESYESSEPNVPIGLLSVDEVERKSNTPIEQVSETAAEVADTAEVLDAPEPVEDLSEEVKVDPLPASDDGENAAPEAGTASIDDHVKLDKESYESSKPIVSVDILKIAEAERKSDTPIQEVSETAAEVADTAEILDAPQLEEDLSKEVKADPLPASDAGVNAPPDAAMASINDNVKLDKEAYESSEPNVPQIVSETAEADELSKEVKIDPLPASESGENAPPIEEPHADAIHDHIKLDKEAYESSEPNVPIVLSKVADLERKSDTPIQEVSETAAEVADTAQRLDEPKDIVDPTPEIAKEEPIVTEESTVSTLDNKTPEEQAKTVELIVTEPSKAVQEAEPIAQKVTELVDESTAHREPTEEMITEPAPQPSASSVHGTTVAKEEVLKVTEQANAADNSPPTVIVSSPTAEEAEDSETSRTVEIIQPAQPPQETTPEGIRRRHITADNRPRSSGSDVVSSKHHRNILFSFWQVFTFRWLGGVSHFFSGIFSSKKKHGTAGR